jgi:zinc/manganese transport system permease protein
MIDLMIPPIVAALVILSIHAYLGLHVIAREIIFVDLAFAQIAALGATAAHVAGYAHGTTASLLASIGFTLLGALVFSLTRMERSTVPQEAIIGITFVVSSAAVILLSGFTAEGTEHLQETMTGTLIWVDWPTIGRLAVVYAAVGVFHYVLRRHFLAVSFQPERAHRIRLWDFLFYASFGVVVTRSVAIAGVLLVFCYLIVPSVAGMLYSDKVGARLTIGWIMGVVTSMLGMYFSVVWDLPTGATIVCTFGAVLIAMAAARPLFRRQRAAV